MSKKTILVTGDLAIDNYIYEGERYSSKKNDTRGVKEISELGGACNIYKILDELMNKAAEDEKRKKEKQSERFQITENWEVFNNFLQPENKKEKWLISHSLWKPYHVKDKIYVWRIHNKLGYGDQSYSREISNLIKKASNPPKNISTNKILVLDDAGFQFRSKTNRWLLNKDYDWIILKMSRPLVSGDLWEELITNYSEKLITIISADEIRAEDYRIMKGFSWEQTVEDTRNLLLSSLPISSLTRSKHLIISYNNDGALWLNNSSSENPVAKLLCNAGQAEDEWSKQIDGEAFGYMSCLTAAIIYKMIDNSSNTSNPDLATGIECGLSAMRNLLKEGHGCFKEVEKIKDIPYGFPVQRIADEIRKPEYKLSTIVVPWIAQEKNDSSGRWMIAEMLQKSPARQEEISLQGLATQVVNYGTKMLRGIPHAVFSKLTTTDRGEIETLRQLKQFMIDYRDNTKANKPISFGVFGPPGAGKSFGVKQIARQVFDKDSWLEFNLSQFTVGSLSELYGAFHVIRDKVLSGILPIVFWDEFDSKKYEWLQYLLSPMQDGEFQEGQLKHSIGKCIFVFAGATSSSYNSFGTFTEDEKGKEALKDFVLKKGPDFKSRLDAYLNVLGPNQKLLDMKKKEVDPADISYPLRRAIFISSKIKYHFYLPAQIDRGLVNALLRVPKYIHGARSLDKLLNLLQSSDGTTLLRSKIPSDTQLSMYVDPVEFNKLLNEPNINIKYFPVEELARAIHLSWSDLTKVKTEEFDKEYEKLSEEEKDDNRAAAKRMQDILAMVNLKILKNEHGNEEDYEDMEVIKKHLEHHIELLAAFEHNGWMWQRIKHGWSYAEVRDNKTKKHNLLKPYFELPNDEKNKDRNSIRNMPDQLKSVGYKIVWIKN